jgi:hypothetical protein
MKSTAKDVERAAVEIVRAAEIARGWQPATVLGQAAQRIEGCDFRSVPPDGGEAHRVEVKGWGVALLKDGSFSFAAEINREQFLRAKSDPTTWRLEIVGNLTAALAGRGQPQRLTLYGKEVVERACPQIYRVRLGGLAEQVADGA